MASRPTGPQPQTATVSPPSISQFSAAMYAVGKISDKNSTCSSVSESGTFSAPKSAKGTRTYSAWPPAYPPNKCEYPKSPDADSPYIFSAIQRFGLELSQSEVSDLR